MLIANMARSVAFVKIIAYDGSEKPPRINQRHPRHSKRGYQKEVAANG